jgi:hypothetical protein
LPDGVPNHITVRIDPAHLRVKEFCGQQRMKIEAQRVRIIPDKCVCVVRFLEYCGIPGVLRAICDFNAGANVSIARVHIDCTGRRQPVPYSRADRTESTRPSNRNATGDRVCARLARAVGMQVNHARSGALP